jgi:hypothetical protein
MYDSKRDGPHVSLPTPQAYSWNRNDLGDRWVLSLVYRDRSVIEKAMTALRVATEDARGEQPAQADKDDETSCLDELVASEARVRVLVEALEKIEAEAKRYRLVRGRTALPEGEPDRGYGTGYIVEAARSVLTKVKGVEAKETARPVSVTAEAVARDVAELAEIVSTLADCVTPEDEVALRYRTREFAKRLRGIVTDENS